MLEERCKLREELLRKKESGHENMRNPQPVQVMKDIKMREFTARKVSYGNKIKCVARHPYASTSEESKDQSIQTEISLKKCRM